MVCSLDIQGNELDLAIYTYISYLLQRQICCHCELKVILKKLFFELL